MATNKDNIFQITFDEAPISVNEYLIPASRMQGNRRIHYVFESQKAKDFKKRFSYYLKREVKNQSWNIAVTKEGHWYLDCVFVQARTNQDNNNYYKILLDTMSKIVIDDDKNIKPRTMRIFYDSKNPRFYAKLYKADNYGVWKNIDEFNNFYSNNCNLCTKNKDRCAVLRRAKESRLNEDEIPMSKGFSTCLKIKRKKK